MGAVHPGGIVNRQAADRIETELRQRFPDREVSTGHVPGGLHIHISDTDGASSMVVITGDEPSAVLTMLTALPEGDGRE